MRSFASPSEPPRQEPIPMSDSVGLDAEQAGSCCAAIAEFRRRAAERSEQHKQADTAEDPAASSSDPTRDA